MAQINRPMYEHFGARHLGVKGPGAMTSLEEGVMGVIPLDLMSDPMYWYIQGLRVFGTCRTISAGGAGNYSSMGISLENTDDNKIVRILKWEILDQGGGAGSRIEMFRCARTAYSSDPGTKGVGLDTRITEAQDSEATIISTTASGSPGTAIACFPTDRGGMLVDNMIPLIVSPGQAIHCVEQTANQLSNQTIWWVEMDAYKAEL